MVSKLRNPLRLCLVIKSVPEFDLKIITKSASQSVPHAHAIRENNGMQVCVRPEKRFPRGFQFIVTNYFLNH